MFLGIAIGDALGKPVEMMKIDKIAKKHGRVTTYLPCDGHKFFDGHPLGSITDDTILSQAVAESLIETGDIDSSLDVQARRYAEALDHAMGGWGRTTKNALKRLKKGVHWSESGKTDDPKCGTGNGIAMKALPLGAYFAVRGEDILRKSMADIALMTHYTRMAVASNLVMALAGAYALKLPTDQIIKDREWICGKFKAFAEHAEKRDYYGNDTEDKLSTQFEKLKAMPDATPQQIVDTFGAGGCYIMWSVPFTLAFWLRNPSSIETVYDLASAGGDTDSNCSMGAGLVGAVSGEGVFPKELVDGLTVKDDILDLADRFCDRFGIK